MWVRLRHFVLIFLGVWFREWFVKLKRQKDTNQQSNASLGDGETIQLSSKWSCGQVPFNDVIRFFYGERYEKQTDCPFKRLVIRFN